jgi:predicted DNA-binding transcriptional regulator AlpA
MPREPLDPNQIFRECDAKAIFGFSHSQLYAKIKSGDIPKPHLLSSPPSRARGWWGWQINAWAENVEQQQEAWAAEAQKYYVPEGGHHPKGSKRTTTAVAPAVAKPKVKKLKGLKRPPAR